MFSWGRAGLVLDEGVLGTGLVLDEGGVFGGTIMMKGKDFFPSPRSDPRIYICIYIHTYLFFSMVARGSGWEVRE